MIDFELTDEQKRWQKKAREFVEKEIKPIAVVSDRKENPRESHNMAIEAKMIAAGFTNMLVPREWGGAGLDLRTAAIVGEELAVGDVGIALDAMTSTATIVSHMNEEQRKRFLHLVRDKERLHPFSNALTEPKSGSDPASMQTTAVLEGNEWVINGNKCFITHGGIARMLAVYAVTDKTKGTRGISAILVPEGTPGVTEGRVEHKIGLRGSYTSELFLDNVRVPKENLLGEYNAGLRLAMEHMNKSRPLAGILPVGLARAAYEAAFRFSKERFDFGKRGFEDQMVSFKLVDMLSTIEATRLMVWKYCWLVDTGQSVRWGGPIAKYFSWDVAIRIATEALEIVGPYGLTSEYPVEKYLRDAKAGQIQSGTPETHKMNVARELIISSSSGSDGSQVQVPA